MIEFLSSWAKSLGVTIVIVSILEMLLPNNKTKKYIRMVLGMFVIFNIISPFITNKDKLNFNSIDIGNIDTYETSSGVSSNVVNQASMDERIEDLYQEELEKDITKKVEEQGFEVSNCKVEAKVPDKNNSENEEGTGITKIKLKIEKSDKKEETNESTENKVVEEIQKIKKVDTSINDSQTDNQDEENNNEENTNEDTNNSKVTRSDIQNIKKMLIEEYGVSEKCLEIN